MSLTVQLANAGHQKVIKRMSIHIAVYLILQRKKQILLLKRRNTGFEDGNYGLPSGHVEEGESVSQALKRESKEEIGIILSPDDIDFVHAMNRNSLQGKVYLDLFFKTDKWLGEPFNNEPTKCERIDWFNTSDLPSNLIPYVKEVLVNYALSKTMFSETGW